MPPYDPAGNVEEELRGLAEELEGVGSPPSSPPSDHMMHGFQALVESKKTSADKEKDAASSSGVPLPAKVAADLALVDAWIKQLDGMRRQKDELVEKLAAFDARREEVEGRRKIVEAQLSALYLPWLAETVDVLQLERRMFESFGITIYHGRPWQSATPDAK
jgi:hypothetical protein